MLSASNAGNATVAPAYRGSSYIDRQSKELDSFELLYEGRSEAGDKAWTARYFTGESSYWVDRDVLDFRNPPPAGTLTRFMTTKSKNEFQGAQANFSYDFDIVKLVAGADWLRYEFQQTQFVPPHAFGAALNRGSDADSSYENIGAYLLARLRLLEDRNLVFSGGVRFDKFKIGLGGTVNNVQQRHQERDFDKVLPSFGISYSPIEELKFRASWGEAFRIPTPRNLVGNFFMGSTFYIGNPALEPEESQTFDIGFDAQWQGLTASASYFTTKYKNYIGTEAAIGGTQYINVPNTKIDGLEISFRYDIGSRLNWDFSLTPYANFTHLFKYKDQDSGRKLASLSRNTMAAGLDLAVPAADFTASLSGVYLSAPEIATYSSQREPLRFAGSSAMVWNLSAVKTLYSLNDKGKFKLRFAIDNMFNKFYGFYGSTAMTTPSFLPGRAFFVSLIWELE
ncbi:MAG: TonB-dependent receptor [Deltaproteobacteria bacterium]|nr:TonB-dependent receptor [Deltaproteobacteria bacterium]